ncbi:hypothetical protein HI914_04637 [Erysiphe necator]|nr:hypothetical protein HI914_04637 [Erysiphe necator]
MDHSPRKRVTRARVAARAAAAAESNSSKTNNKVMTTSKAGPTTMTTSSATSLSSSSSSSKRKIQNDIIHAKEGDRQIIEVENKITLPKYKTTRSQTRRACTIPEAEIKTKTEPEPEATDNIAARKPTRGRPRKILSAESLPPRTLRGRVTRATNIEEKQKPPIKDEKISKHQRQQDTISTTISTITKTSGPKRCAKFEGPGKENINPSSIQNQKKCNVKKEETQATGFRAKPLRKPASTTRSTRGRNKPMQQEGDIKSSTCNINAKELERIDDKSSKAVAKEYSDDELMLVTKSVSRSPLKASPIRPTMNVIHTSDKSEFLTSSLKKIEEPSNSETYEEKIGVIASPARRPPQTPPKQKMKINNQSLGTGSSVLRSSKPTKMFIPELKLETLSISNKPSLLHSPARRFPQPLEYLISGGDCTSNLLPDIVDEYEINKEDSQVPSSVAAPKSVKKIKLRNTINEVNPDNIQLEKVSQLEYPKQSNHNLDNMICSEAESVFSGRMSSIVPRDIDPTFAPESLIQETKIIIDTSQQDLMESTLTLENLENITNEGIDDNNTPSFPHFESKLNPFMLRRDIDPILEDSDSEDELSSIPAFCRNTFVAPSPYPKIGSVTSRSSLKGQMKPNDCIGFTPLAQKFSHWMTSSPEKKSYAKVRFPETLNTIWDSENIWSGAEVENQNNMELSTKTNSVGNKVEISNQKATQLVPTLMGVDDVQDEERNELEETEIDEEDLELAFEANEMSLLEPSQTDTLENVLLSSEQPPYEIQDNQISSELKMERKNVSNWVENENSSIHKNKPCEVQNNPELQDISNIAIDPRLLALPYPSGDNSFSTPRRTYTERVYHTVCKVPLKPAASETPEMPVNMRCVSASRIPSIQSTSHLNQAGRVSNLSFEEFIQDSVTMTPNKPVIDWSSLGTPARTPRVDLNTSLLNGAVVFVDVYTSEGADASIIFIELLTQMGARCIKSWSWNGNIEEGKIGITHVVYKDGGKRTMERIRDSDGAVICVGVSWVLDCERENKWLDETPYLIDIDVFPRGGNRRRKSMEPRALANLNGTLIPCLNTSRTSQRRCYSVGGANGIGKEEGETPMTSKSHRRDSVQWLRTGVKEEELDEEIHSFEGKENNYFNFTSTLPPLTPSGVVNEKIFYNHTFSDKRSSSLHIGNRVNEGEYIGTPLNQEDEEDDDVPYFLQKEKLQQKTAPVKQRYFDAECQKEIINMDSINYSKKDNNYNRTTGCAFNDNPTSSIAFTTASNFTPSNVAETHDYAFMMRLKAARRKSLQWAPKIGSPLAKAF